MKKIIAPFFILTFLIVGLFTLQHPQSVVGFEEFKANLREWKQSHPSKPARAAYFHQMLQDPVTGKIPSDLRARELRFADRVAADTRIRRSKNPDDETKIADLQITWATAGPVDVGGRIRAIALDVRNSDIVIVGGVSGGIWKSNDAGATWTLKSKPEDFLNVTSLAQDTRPGQEDTWYYTTGEFDGASAWDFGFTAPIYGSGVWKSTDNGESWQALESTVGLDPHSFRDNFFDFATKVVVSPTTGSVFVGTNGYGVFRSFDGGLSWTGTLANASPGVPSHFYSDVDVASNGRLIATLSASSFAGTDPDPVAGVYTSTDDGLSWDDVTPASFNADHDRTVLTFAPSNPDIAYSFTDTGLNRVAGGDSVLFVRYNFASGTLSDRSANIPFWGEPVGDITTQGAYNMHIQVKPDDENFVVLGHINLLRSTNAFATPPPTGFGEVSFRLSTWIGGYLNSNEVGLYAGHHPDCHSFAFVPGTTRAFSVHDGGVSLTEDITATQVTWSNRDSRLFITQFYNVSQPNDPTNNLIMGGAQDNGSPLLRLLEGGLGAGISRDVSSGDGAFSHLGAGKVYSSSQRGFLNSLDYNPAKTEANFNTFARITPPAAENQDFIHPFAVDPNNDNNIYYPDGNTLFRTNLGADIGNGAGKIEPRLAWTLITATSLGLASTEQKISALTVTRSNPENVLYMGVSTRDQLGSPLLLKMADASSASTATKTTIPGPSNAYVHDIAVNPSNGNEILVILSNYNIESIFHSTDGGATLTPVEGNLSGPTQLTPTRGEVEIGPSIRGATIVPHEDGFVYVVATSTGVYFTDALQGEQTQWQPSLGTSGSSQLGNIVVSTIKSRPADGRILIGTHGRGMLVGRIQGAVPLETVEQIVQDFILEQNFPNPFNPSTNIRFQLPAAGTVSIEVFDANGRKVAQVANNQPFSSGLHTMTFDANNLASGVYISRVVAQVGNRQFSKTQKMTLIK